MTTICIGNVTETLHREVKSVCAKHGISMSEAIRNYMYRITGIDKDEVQEIKK